MPKFHLLYFKNLLDVSIVRFFDAYNDSFVKIDNKYVLSKNMNQAKLFKIFKQYITEELSKLTLKYDRLSPNYYLILGSCLPKDNLLLQFKNTKYFPKKLEAILNSDYNIKYVLKEKDIDIDIKKFNTVCFDLSNKFFCNDFIVKCLGKDYKNIFFVQHRNIDCYVLFKILKHIYGKSNCINMYTEYMQDKKLPLIAINDIIGKYINKSDMNKSDKLNVIAKEIEQYIQEKIEKL